MKGKKRWLTLGAAALAGVLQLLAMAGAIPPQIVVVADTVLDALLPDAVLVPPAE